MVDWPTRLARYRGLIFDCDGTLTDSMPLHYVAWRTTMSRYDIEFTESLFYQWAGKPTDEIIRRLSDRHGVEVDVATAAEQKENHFKQRIDQVSARGELLEVVSQMNGRAVMSVASGGDRDVVLAQLRQIGLTETLPIVVAAEDTSRHKPHPAPFLEAARRMEVNPADCLVWEDSPLGIEAATAAGMASVDVRGPRNDWIWHCEPPPGATNTGK